MLLAITSSQVLDSVSPDRPTSKVSKPITACRRSRLAAPSRLAADRLAEDAHLVVEPVDHRLVRQAVLDVLSHLGFQLHRLALPVCDLPLSVGSHPGAL